MKGLSPSHPQPPRAGGPWGLGGTPGRWGHPPYAAPAAGTPFPPSFQCGVPLILTLPPGGVSSGARGGLTPQDPPPNPAGSDSTKGDGCSPQFIPHSPRARGAGGGDGPSWECGPGDGPGVGRTVRGFWGGGDVSALLGIYILDHAVAPKFMRSSMTGGRLLPLPPTVLSLCAAHAAWGVHRVSSPCTPRPPRGVWEQGRGCRGHPAVLTSKAQGTQGSSEGLGGLPWRGVRKKGRVSRTPVPFGCWVQGGYAPPHTPKMAHLVGGHSPPNPSWPATPPERRAEPSAPTGTQQHPCCSAPHRP